MIDLHSHVLFDIDDGAQTIEDSLAILARAEKLGVKAMVATPHFTIGDDVDEFVKKRTERIEAIKEEAEAAGINVKVLPGAEVYITDELFNETDIKKLTLAETDVILAEFKYHSVKAEAFLEYIDEMISQGVRVLVAHPERYSYLNNNMRLLEAILHRGVMLQVNAISLYEDSEEGDAARMMLKNNMAFAVSSDIHHASSRRLDAIAKLNENERWKSVLYDNPLKLITHGRV